MLRLRKEWAAELQAKTSKENGGRKLSRLAEGVRKRGSEDKVREKKKETREKRRKMEGKEGTDFFLFRFNV